jgi:hypothetical protein
MLGWLFKCCSCKKNKNQQVFDLIKLIMVKCRTQSRFDDINGEIAPDLSSLREHIESGNLNLNARDGQGWTLFHRIVQLELACSRFSPRGERRLNRDNLISLSLDEGADIDAQTNDRARITALHLAVRAGHSDLADMLEARGAGQVRDKSGRTPSERLHKRMSADEKGSAKISEAKGLRL